MGEAARALIDALYTRLVLRDLIGKVVPGAIALFAIGERFSNGLALFSSLRLPSAALTAFVIGASWLTALALQSLGEMLHVIRYWPAHLNKAAQRYELRIRFLQLATQDEKQQAERFSILMEASALSAMSLAAVTLVGISHVVTPGSGSAWRS